MDANGILVWCYGTRSLILILALMNAPKSYIGSKTNYIYSFWVFAIHYYMDAKVSDYICGLHPILIVQILGWIVVCIAAITSGTMLKLISPTFFSLFSGNRNEKYPKYE